MQAQRRSLVLAGAAGMALSMTGLVLAQSKERVITIVARRFVFLPGEIELKRGEPVVFELTAPEVVMGFSIPAMKLRTDIIPGQVARLRVVPQQVGTFGFLCDVFCGDGHEGMSGQLIVVN